MAEQNSQDVYKNTVSAPLELIIQNLWDGDVESGNAGCQLQMVTKGPG